MPSLRITLILAALVVFIAGPARAGSGQACSVPYSVHAVTQQPQFETFYGVGMALRQNGRPLLAFYGRAVADSGDEAVWVHSCLDAACSPGRTKKLFRSVFVVGKPEVLIRPNGQPLIVNGEFDAVNVFDCQDSHCNRGENRPITPAYSATASAVVAVRGDQRPVFAFNDRHAHTIDIATCNDVDCLTTARKTVVTEATAFPMSIAMALTSDDRPVIAYTADVDGGTQFFRLAVCDTPACDQPSIRTLDSRFAFWLSIGMRSDDRAVIHAQLDQSGMTPKELFICDDVNCQSATIRPMPVIAETRELVIDAQDRPILTVGSGFYGFYHCSTPDCLAYEPYHSLGMMPAGGAVRAARKDRGPAALAVLDYQTNTLNVAVCSDTAVFSNGSENDLDLEAAAEF